MVLDKLWDDVVAGPQPESGLGRLRKVSINTLQGQSSGSNNLQRSLSMPEAPSTPTTPSNLTSPSTPRANVWRSVFNPGSNIATKTLGSNLFDKPQPNTPTVYDWMYSNDTRSNHR